MSWDNFYSNVKKAVGSAADKINQTADLATLQVKLSVAERKLDEAYTALGRAAYRHFSSEENSADAVAACMQDVERARREVTRMKRQIKDMRKEESTSKEANAESVATEHSDTETDSES